MIVGQQEIYLEETESTNQYAKEMVSNTTPFEGTAIFADYQFTGRGQNGNVWQGSAGKNLYLSVILYPKFLALANHYFLNKAICLSVWELISAYLSDVKIKWPNDLYVRDKKIAGILIENQLQGANWNNAIVGIGVNINQKNFPTGLAATSLALELQKVLELKTLRKELYALLDKNYLAVRNSQKDRINRVYTQNLLGYQEENSFLHQGKKIHGKIMGVKNSGEICLEMNGKLQYFSHGDIQQQV